MDVRRWVAAGVGLVAVAGCGFVGGVPDREADVTGVVAVVREVPVLVEPSDPYFDGMSLLGGDPVFLSASGGRVASADLVARDRVEVWVGDVCAESYPVQCEVEVVRLLE